MCAVVQEPANTWSNLAYILVGLWILAQARKRHPFRILAAAVIVMGSLSLIYHASNTYATQVLDFVGMFAYIGLLLVWNLRRLGFFAGRTRSVVVYFLVVYANMALLLVFPLVLGLPIQAIILFNTILAFGLEAFLARRTAAVLGTRPYRDYGMAAGLLTLASAASALDLSRRWCDPANHWIQGHALWHVLTAASVVFVFRFYASVGTAPANPSARQL